MKLLFLRLAFSFFFWMIGELVRTSPERLLVTLDGPEFDPPPFFFRVQFHENLAFLSVKLGWMLMDGRMKE